MSWTDDRIALLKKLWGEGRTAAEIADQLGGVTRNAVIGKAHRLKLSNRVSPIQENKQKSSPAAPAVKAPEKKIQKLLEQDNNRTGIPLSELGPRMCRWPFGDPKEERFGFCAAQQVEGLPYCPEHAKVAYQAATRNRILQAEQFERDTDDQDARVPVPEKPKVKKA